jgi:hypothetical protein
VPFLKSIYSHNIENCVSYLWYEKSGKREEREIEEGKKRRKKERGKRTDGEDRSGR